MAPADSSSVPGCSKLEPLDFSGLLAKQVRRMDVPQLLGAGLFELPRSAEGSGSAYLREGMRDSTQMVLATDELECPFDGVAMAGVWRRRQAV